MTTTCVSCSAGLSWIAFYEVALGASACYLRIAPFLESEMLDAYWGFFGDREVTGGIAKQTEGRAATRTTRPGIACREKGGHT